MRGLSGTCSVVFGSLFVDEIILGLSGSAPLGSFDLRGYSGYELVVLGLRRVCSMRELSVVVVTPDRSSITPIRGVEDPHQYLIYQLWLQVLNGL